MRTHMKDYWPAYMILSLMLAGMAAAVRFGNEDQRRVNYCYERGAVLVQTDAGARCAPLYSLERIR